jgi:hypothetical protein
MLIPWILGMPTKATILHDVGLLLLAQTADTIRQDGLKRRHHTLLPPRRCPDVGLRQPQFCTLRPSRCVTFRRPYDSAISGDALQIVGEEMHHLRPAIAGAASSAPRRPEVVHGIAPLLGNR